MCFGSLKLGGESWTESLSKEQEGSAWKLIRGCLLSRSKFSIYSSVLFTDEQRRKAFFAFWILESRLQLESRGKRGINIWNIIVGSSLSFSSSLFEHPWLLFVRVSLQMSRAARKMGATKRESTRCSVPWHVLINDKNHVYTSSGARRPHARLVPHEFDRIVEFLWKWGKSWLELVTQI